MERALSAPGKLFLSGEYAVLWGGAARVLAVGPRTAALVRSRQDTRVQVLLEEGRLDGRATPFGVASNRTSTASRSRLQVRGRIISPMAADAIASAAVKPVSAMTSAAMTTAIEPSRSPSTSR